MEDVNSFQKWAWANNPPDPPKVNLERAMEVAARFGLQLKKSVYRTGFLEVKDPEKGEYAGKYEFDVDGVFFETKPHANGMIFRAKIEANDLPPGEDSRVYRFLEALANEVAPAVIKGTPERVVELPTPRWVEATSYSADGNSYPVLSSKLMFASEARAALEAFIKEAEDAISA